MYGDIILLGISRQIVALLARVTVTVVSDVNDDHDYEDYHLFQLIMI